MNHGVPMTRPGTMLAPHQINRVHSIIWTQTDSTEEVAPDSTEEAAQNSSN